jgi:uncharacterized membrane protein YgdD (TMEM256/DUF423 family)
MNKNLIITCVLGAVTIILGAFGAHALQEILSSNELKSFETGVRYQMYHVLVLLFVNTQSKLSEKIRNNLSVLFFLGILLFSGSIYAITFGLNVKYVWFVTPIGGLFFILGWLKMAYSYFKIE